jgi:hypothetical protein
MACDTCTHTLEKVGNLNALCDVFHCPRCGTWVTLKHSSLVPELDVIRREVYVPTAVRRARELLGAVWEEADVEKRGGLVNSGRVIGRPAGPGRGRQRDHATGVNRCPSSSVRLLESDVTNGRAYLRCGCPAALAIGRACGRPVEVDYTHCKVYQGSLDGPFVRIDLPAEVGDWIRAFDYAFFARMVNGQRGAVPRPLPTFAIVIPEPRDAQGARRRAIGPAGGRLDWAVPTPRTDDPGATHGRRLHRPGDRPGIRADPQTAPVR